MKNAPLLPATSGRLPSLFYLLISMRCFPSGPSQEHLSLFIVGVPYPPCILFFFPGIFFRLFFNPPIFRQYAPSPAPRRLVLVCRPSCPSEFLPCPLFTTSPTGFFGPPCRKHAFPGGTRSPLRHHAHKHIDLKLPPHLHASFSPSLTPFPSRLSLALCVDPQT